MAKRGVMKRVFFLEVLLTLVLGIGIGACGDDPLEPSNNNTNNNNNGGEEKPFTPTAKDIVVTVDENGNVNDGHRFTVIDEYNFYIDEIKYTLHEDEVIVSGYNSLFKGDANIISILRYRGRGLELKVTSIGGGAFSDCSGLTSVSIPSSVTSVGGLAFSDCSGLTSVTIPEGVTSIEHSAFS